MIINVHVHTNQPRPRASCITSFVCECALFGIVRLAMLGRLSPLLLINYLPKLHLNAVRRSITGTSNVRHISRSFGTNGSDDRRGDDNPMAVKLEHSFQLLGVDKQDCTVEQIRKAYIDLVKRYHPDARTPHVSAGKSAEVCLQH